jgi:hypothetical protein
MSLVRILYVSAARADLRNQDLSDILTSARNNNPRLGVTGTLLFVNGAFLQVVEGPAMHMDTLFHRIALDPRHSGVKCLIKRETSERRFPDRSMGFCGIEVRNAEGARLCALVQGALRSRLDDETISVLSSLAGAYSDLNASRFAERPFPDAC